MVDGGGECHSIEGYYVPLELHRVDGVTQAREVEVSCGRCSSPVAFQGEKRGKMDTSSQEGVTCGLPERESKEESEWQTG
jgi:hypothetical protein